MSQIRKTKCDDCKKELEDEDPQYCFKMGVRNVVKEERLRFPFEDLCQKCAEKALNALGGSILVWTRSELKKKKRDELREICKEHWPEIKGRDKEDLIQSLTGKPIAGPPKK